MNPANNLESAIEQLHITTRAETDKRILNDAFSVLEASIPKTSPEIRRNIWRMIMTSKMAGLAAVAAVIVVAFSWFFGTRPAKDVDLRHIYEALGEAENICVATFIPDKSEPVQRQWISQTLNLSMFRIGEQLVLWDIPNKAKKTRYLSSKSVQTEAITEQMLTEFEKSVTRPFGLLPFTDYKDVPKDIQWSRVADMDFGDIVPGTQVYDLIWTTQTPAIEFHKWRLFMDTDTNLTKRAERYVKFKPEDEYSLEGFIVVTYPDESEIQSLVHNTFGSTAGRPAEPGYIGTPGAER
ncbi:MAG: hypothetical protein ACYTFW_07995 [Planctomycetota bacterium]|jgi:hypothetical protein